MKLIKLPVAVIVLLVSLLIPNYSGSLVSSHKSLSSSVTIQDVITRSGNLDPSLRTSLVIRGALVSMIESNPLYRTAINSYLHAHGAFFISYSRQGYNLFIKYHNDNAIPSSCSKENFHTSINGIYKVTCVTAKNHSREFFGVPLRRSMSMYIKPSIVNIPLLTVLMNPLGNSPVAAGSLGTPIRVLVVVVNQHRIRDNTISTIKPVNSAIKFSYQELTFFGAILPVLIILGIMLVIIAIGFVISGTAP